MAAVGIDDFAGPCGSELALPPLFGGTILESEPEQELEFGAAVHEEAGGEDEDEGGEEEEEEDGAARRLRQERDRRKHRALQRRCREMESVNDMLLNRLEYVKKITQRLKKERRFLMKSLDCHGDSYRSAQLTILLEEAGCPAEEGLLGDVGPGGLMDGPDGQAARPQGASSPMPSEGSSVKRKRIKEERDPLPGVKRQYSPFYLLTHDQIKQECSDEELSPRDVTETLGKCWQPASPDDKAAYSDYPSPGPYPDFD
ncbi:TCF3 fusion partner-like [Scyliorhinus torazame]|uniref:TCF3 fusion partner-like n=1 Tax=Scyliorhinus torazame TaxID=75743 RepID=UPI003B5C84D3